MRRELAALAVLIAAPLAAVAGGGTQVLPAIIDAPPEARVAFAGGVELRSRVPGFGGFSAIEVSEDGARFVALSDTAQWLEGRLMRRDGRLVDVEIDRFAPLRGPDGGRAAPVERDSEGLAIPAPDLSGERLVSFERDHRIGAFAGGDAPETEAWRLPDWRGYGTNNGFEGLAVRPDGAILALREADADETSQEAEWLFPDGGSRPARMPREEGFIATGADFGPDGLLYVVDRGFGLFSGFETRLRRLRVEGDALTDEEELLRVDAAQGADNAEGVAAWRDPDGRIRLTVVTDDNYNMIQRTLVLEFVVGD